MGVTINVPMTLPSQITIPSYYTRLRGDIRVLKQNMPSEPTVGYRLEACFDCYASKQAMQSMASVINTKIISIVQGEPFTGNLYDVVYSELKKDVTDYVDDI
jgi:hypothetical protein